MKYKFLVCLLCAFMIVGVTACGDTSAETVDTTETTEETEEAAEETPTEEEVPDGAQGVMTDLLVEDVAGLTDLDFSPDTKTYELTVFEDVYGLRFSPSIQGSADSSVEVTMSGTGIEDESLTVEKNGKFELHLTESRAANITGPEELQEPLQENDCDYTVTITDAASTYTINIHRPGASELVEQFTRLQWPVPDGSGKTMDYYIYLPEDYATSGKEYPVLISPHGGGQFRNDAEDILIRTAQATSMVKYGKDCVVIAPQGNYSDLSVAEDEIGWCDPETMELSAFGEGTMEILNSLEEEHEGLTVDWDRIYVAGGSMGGIGSCGFLASYPEVFAAGVVCCPAFMTENGAQILAQAAKEHSIPIWFVHAEADPTIPYSTTEVVTDAFDEAEVDYYETIYSDSHYFWPTAHFSWVPFLDNEENLDWLLSQSKSGDGKLTGLIIEDSAGLVDFSFDQFEYDDAGGSYRLSEPITVFEDVYGLRFTPTVAGSGSDEINVAVDTEDDGLLKLDQSFTYEDNTWTDGQDGESSLTVAKNQRFVLHLSEKRLCSAYEEQVQEDDCNYTITISDGLGDEYIIDVLRPGTDKLTGTGEDELTGGGFTLNTWPVPDDSGKDMYYYLYLPQDYDASNEYPVLIVPHGGGQFRNPVKDTLVRTAQATSMVHYDKDVILIVPHGNYTDLSAEEIGWCDSETLELSAFGEGVMEILSHVQEEYSVDENRIYVAGGSMGGVGTEGFLACYPEVFAAGAICCPAGGTAESCAELAKAMKEQGTALWLIHSEADPTIEYGTTQTLREALDAEGVSYMLTVQSHTDFLYPTNHFSWTEFFDNEICLDWMLAQSK